MRRSLSVLVFAFLAMVLAAPMFAQDNPFVGTWNLNVAKSKFVPGPAPKSLTRTVTASGSGAKYSFDGVAADGTSYSYSFTTTYEGKDSPVTGTGTPAGADTIALKRINPHKVEGTLKKGGKEVGRVTAEVSKDGKVSTVRMKGKTADGKDIDTDSVYEKQ